MDMAIPDLCPPEWATLEPAEVEHVILSVMQHAQGSSGDYVAFPTDGDSCRLRLHYDKDGRFSISPGSAFDANEWQVVRRRIADELTISTPAIARAIAFSSYPVTGGWTSEALELAIMPPPPDAPLPTVTMADHPFALEFRMQRSADQMTTNLRRQAVERRLCMLLNVLLDARITHNSSQARHFWGVLPPDIEDSTDGHKMHWIQASYWVKGLPDYVDSLSDFASPVEIVPAGEYYPQLIVHRAGEQLQVPDNLEQLIAGYRALSSSDASRFDRASYWLDVSGRVWSDSRSASYTALSTALESLLEVPPEPRCSECGKPESSITTTLRNFIDEYAPDEGTYLEQPAAVKAYHLRSRITHGERILFGD